MTNYERYKDEIDKVWESEDIACFTKNGEIKPCCEIVCPECEFNGEEGCNSKSQKWLVSEYKDPAEDVDWSKVPVDTPVLVRNYETDKWNPRYFAGINENGNVTAFDSGATSWSNDGENLTINWKQAKLANPDDLKKSEFHQEKRKYTDKELIDMLAANYAEKVDNDIYFNQENYKEFLEAVYWFWKCTTNNFNKRSIAEAINKMLNLEFKGDLL
jgi:hypothetical protein